MGQLIILILNVPELTITPDRWMSKAIYYLKLALLVGTFAIEEREMIEVNKLAEFVALFYAPVFFKSPLPSSAASNDLLFMEQMKTYAKFAPEISREVIKSCTRHLWYLTPQLVVFALVDNSTQPEEKQELALKLYHTKREENVKSG